MSFVASRQQAVKLSNLVPTLTDISAAIQASKTKWSRKQVRPDTTCLGQSATREQGLLGVSEATLGIGGLMKFSTAGGTPIHGRNTEILIDAYALKAYVQSGSFKRSIVLPDTTCLGDAWRRHAVLGLQTAKINFSGLYDAVASGIDARFRAMAAATSVVPFSVAYNGWTIGQLVDMCAIVNDGFDIGGDAGGSVPISGSFMSDGIPDAGVSLHGLTAETTTVNSTSVDEGAATALGGVAHLHVTSITGTSATIKVQHSTDDITYADLISFGAITAAGSARTGTNSDTEAADTTTVNRYVRSAITAVSSLSSITYVVAWARRGYTSATVAPAGTHRCFAGLLTISTAPTFNYSPEGLASGKNNFTGSCRAQDYSINFSTSNPIDWSMTLLSDSTIAESTN